MPGEPLMCVWQTACVLDQGGRHDKVQKTHLKTIAEKLDSSTAHINYSRKQFEDYFTQRSVSRYLTRTVCNINNGWDIICFNESVSKWRFEQAKWMLGLQMN